MIVVDGSVLAVALADDGPDGDRARARVGGLDQRRAALALNDLDDLLLRRAPHLPLVRRCWELRDNLTPYDAAYVALAEALEITLLTAGRGITQAPGPRCAMELLRPAS